MSAEVEQHWHALLVVEDEREIRDAISNLFDFNACTVRNAMDGQQAVAQERDRVGDHPHDEDGRYRDGIPEHVPVM